MTLMPPAALISRASPWADTAPGTSGEISRPLRRLCPTRGGIHGPAKFSQLSVSLVSDPKVCDPYAETARRIGKTPVWIFHGDAAAVPVEESCKMYAALQTAQANVKYTEYSRRKPRILKQRLCRAGPGPVAAGTPFCRASQPPCPSKTGRDKDRGTRHPRGKG
jgi:hypothetical protein